MSSFRSWRKTAQAKGVRDDEDARESHRTARDKWIEKSERRERERRDVVGERPEQIAFDRRERPAREADRVARRAEVTANERQVARLDRDVCARAEREPEIGLRERRRVVDAVADHRDDA